jgi:hypothetical protein
MKLTLPKQMTRRKHRLPVLWCHGTNDNEIPTTYGEDAIAFMSGTLNIQDECIIYKSYEGLTHTTNDIELADVTAWLVRISG